MISMSPIPPKNTSPMTSLNPQKKKSHLGPANPKRKSHSPKVWVKVLNTTPHPRPKLLPKKVSESLSGPHRPKRTKINNPFHRTSLATVQRKNSRSVNLIQRSWEFQQAEPPKEKEFQRKVQSSRELST